MHEILNVSRHLIILNSTFNILQHTIFTTYSPIQNDKTAVKMSILPTLQGRLHYESCFFIYQ